MLLFGPSTVLPDISNMKIVSLYSMKEGYYRLKLSPPFEITSGNPLEFDMTYANYLINNNDLFVELMSLIMPLYNGEDVFCIVDQDPYLEQLAESLAKFIQQRYGYNYAIINKASDISYLSIDNFTFTVQGIYTLDIDKDRYAKLRVNQRNINNTVYDDIF